MVAVFGPFLPAMPVLSYDGYFNGWKPCVFSVVPYQEQAYFVGMQCVLIPDIDALGVQSVEAASPAEVAGLRPGDMILTVNEKELTAEAVLNHELPTGKLVLEVLREGAEDSRIVTVYPKLVPAGVR